jgi:hypothetical protein
MASNMNRGTYQIDEESKDDLIPDDLRKKRAS